MVMLSRKAMMGSRGGWSYPELITDDFSADSGLWLDGDLTPAAITVEAGRATFTPKLLDHEMLANWDFTAWTNDNPDGWTVFYETAPDHEVTERDSEQGHADTKTVGGSVNFYATAVNNRPTISQTDVLTPGKLYYVLLTGSKGEGGNSLALNTMGSWNWWYGGAPMVVAGVGTSALVSLIPGNAPNDITIDSVSIKEIDHASAWRLRRIYYPSAISAYFKIHRALGTAYVTQGLGLFHDLDNYLVATLTCVGASNVAVDIHLRVAGTYSFYKRAAAKSISGAQFSLVPNATMTAFSVLHNGQIVFDSEPIGALEGITGPWYGGWLNTYVAANIADHYIANFEAARVPGALPFLGGGPPPQNGGGTAGAKIEDLGVLMQSAVIDGEGLYG